ncbi:Ig domain-containing protein [Aquirhabdus sp.]|uniref:Ig-like domain-containing protein n=1 Tax=Aquirhabdus sp. TaxID=2824160 RepID=UPI00396C9679
MSFILAACGGGGGDGGVVTATLQSVTVTPTSASVAAGLTQQFSATGNYSDGTSQAIASPTWTSSDQTVATIDGKGLVTSRKAGTATLTASFNGISGSTTLTVTTAKLQSITVTPASSSVAAGLTQQFTATGNYSDGTSQAIATPAWSSSDTTTATVNTTGLVTSIKAGSATLTATLSGISGSAALTVTTATLQKINVTPASPSIAAGLTQQLTATGVYSDGTTQAIATPIWSSTNTTAATVDANGLVKTLKAGSSTIVATYGGITGGATLTVTTAKLISIKVIPPLASAPIVIGQPLVFPTSSTFPVGLSARAVAQGQFSDGSVQEINPIWSSSDITVATVASTGIVTSLAIGKATITATLAGVSGSGSITINSATLSSIVINSPSNSHPYPLHYVASTFVTATYSDGNSYPVQNAIWSSSDSSIVTVDTTGKLTVNGVGTVTLTASFKGKTATQSMTSVAPAAKPTFVITCDPTTPMSISSAQWNALYSSDSIDSTQWAVVDPVSCAAYPLVVLRIGTTEIFSSLQSSPTSFYPATTYISNPITSLPVPPPITFPFPPAPLPLHVGDQVTVISFDNLTNTSTPLYTITAQ